VSGTASSSESNPNRKHRRRRRSRKREKSRLERLPLVVSVVLIVGIMAAMLYGNRNARVAVPGTSQSTKVYGYEVVNEYPHDVNAFTEGLVYRDGSLYESTGLEGESTLRKVELETGRVLRRHDVPDKIFGEGLTEWGSTLIQLTYTAKIAFVYDLDTFTERTRFNYAGQGWGLTHDQKRLIMSDGSATLRFFDPGTFQQLGLLQVTDNGRPVTNLNELEFVNGDIYANVWHSNRIAVIDPAFGGVREWIDLAGLNPDAEARSEAVLNGIAYDAVNNRLFVTGNRWQRVYEIRVRRPVSAH
jgi:glutaminyl-peptide cyclotransferase